MDSVPMTRFPAPEIEDLPEDVRDHLLAEMERAGFTPNYYTAMAYKPRQYRAFFDYYESLIHNSPLEREEIEILTVAVSGANNCPYCVIAHGALLRLYGDDPYLAEQLMINHRTADISETHKIMCDFAIKLTHRPAKITDDDIEQLQARGFSKEEIWDIGAVTALFNLSNRMALLANIRPNEEFFDMGRNLRGEVVEDLKDPYFAVDAENCLIDFNPASKHLVNDLSENNIGDPITKVVPELTDQIDDFRTRETIDTVISIEQDTQRYYDVSVVPRTQGPPNVQQGRLIVLRDITLLKESQEALERKNERLDSFASIVSHDLRNPLNVAQGYLEIITEDSDRKEVARIDDALGRMETLIEQLLTFARMGETALNPEPLWVQQTAEVAWQTVETEQATLDVVSREEMLSADKTRLKQLFENLFRNAVEHGGNDVTIRVGPLTTGFYVEDDGSGIPANEREEVFDTGYSTNESGTGFGLAIVNQIAEAHGWNTRVTDGEMGGARFEFSDTNTT